jgi:hypothetical protein
MFFGLISLAGLLKCHEYKSIHIYIAIFITVSTASVQTYAVYKRNYLGRQAVYIENKYLFGQEQSLI